MSVKGSCSDRSEHLLYCSVYMRDTCIDMLTTCCGRWAYLERCLCMQLLMTKSMRKFQALTDSARAPSTGSLKWEETCHNYTHTFESRQHDHKLCLYGTNPTAEKWQHWNRWQAPYLCKERGFLWHSPSYMLIISVMHGLWAMPSVMM